jgi:hypothetical protein
MDFNRAYFHVYFLCRLFLGICDDDLVDQILLNNRQYCQKSICAIRFGAMNRMVDLKEIGIRVIIVDSKYSL